MKQKIVAIALMVLFAFLSAAQAAELKAPANKLLTLPEIATERAKIEVGMKESQRRKVQWCSHEMNAPYKTECESAQSWLFDIGKFLVGQLNVMEKAVKMADSPVKEQLTLTMDVERLNAEREMAAYRAGVIAGAFNPNRQQSALEKR